MSTHEGESQRLITIEQEVTLELTGLHKTALLEHVNKYYYGAPEVPLGSSITQGHQQAVAQAVRSHRLTLSVTYNQHGEIVAAYIERRSAQERHEELLAKVAAAGTVQEKEQVILDNLKEMGLHP